MKRTFKTIHSYLVIVLFLLLSSLTHSLKLSNPSDFHLQSTDNEQQQFNYLIGIQKNYVDGVNALGSQAKSIRARLDQTTRLEDRIKILQGAITDERSKISILSNKIIPDPNSGYFECQTLPQDKQQNWSGKANQLQIRIKQLEQLTRQIPQCDETRALNEQIRKAKLNLYTLQKTITNQCQQNLERISGVYQTNLYHNDKWVLGRMTMDDLIEDYYQRALKYGNITNCPVDRPFMTTSVPSYSDSACVACRDPNKPYFDMSLHACINCPPDQSIDPTTHRCAYVPRNSNYTLGPNYRLQPLTQLPPPNQNLTSCPANAPFYNNTLCVACPLPYNYWQISESRCVTCPNGQLFNVNIRQCVEKLTKALTKLIGTDWVTQDGNITRVMSQRARILQINKTTGQYSLCPDNTPFYDSISCIQCPSSYYFNIDTLRCQLPPNSTVYNPNMHKFVGAQQNYEMDPNAPRYITTQTLTDNPNIPNCNTSYPYYDQIACIRCLPPFDIFNYDNKRCVACQARNFYNQTARACQPRPSIYVNGSRNQLLATQRVSIADYNNTLRNAVLKNPELFPDTCPDPNQYAAITKCVPCDTASGQYFNVQTLSCTFCDGYPDPKSSLCRQRMYYFVNPSASNLILPAGTTLQDMKTSNDKIIQSNPQKYSTCPITDPYPYNNKTVCGKCPPQAMLYNVALEGCTNCEAGSAYDGTLWGCRQVFYLTDYNKNVIIRPPQTLNTFLANQAEINRTQFTSKCPAGTPYTTDNRNCINCSDQTPYFDVVSLQCINCPQLQTYSPQRKQCYETQYLTNLSAPRILQSGNYTIPNEQNKQNIYRSNSSIKVVDCNLTAPYATKGMCINCQDNSYFSLETQTCVQCPQGSAYWPATRQCRVFVNITNLTAATARIVQNDSYTLEKYKADIEQQKRLGPYAICPQSVPFAINGVCTPCVDPNGYFILATQSCGFCDNFVLGSNTCPPKPSRYPNLTNYLWVTNDGNADRVVRNAYALKANATGPMCPQFYNQTSKDCINCPQNQYYNYDLGGCQRCPQGTVFDINIHLCASPAPPGKFYTSTAPSSDKYFLYGAWTFNELDHIISSAKNASSGQFCPPATPYYDNIQCIRCPDYKKYFNLRYQLCQVCLAGETLAENDCYNSSGDKVWRQPDPQHVYPFLFGSFSK